MSTSGQSDACITESNNGAWLLIPRIRLAPSATNLPFILQRTQFPVRLVYCMTINKSQGQTFDRVGLYFGNPVFFQARSFSDIHVKIEQTVTQGVHQDLTITQNVVFKEVL